MIFKLPYAGQENPYLGPEATTTEHFGDFKRNGMVEGKCSWFGGPNDTGVGPLERGAISHEVLRELDPNGFYCAMRFNYGEDTEAGIIFWRAARLLVRNPANGVSVVVRPIDWGPNPDTGRIIDLSPGAISGLRAQTDDLVEVSFAPVNAAVGVQ